QHAWQAIVDNDTSPEYSEFNASSFTTTTSNLGYAGSRYRFANAVAQETAAAWWRPSFPAADSFAVYVWYTAGANRSGAAKYLVFHSGGRTVVEVDQRVNGSRWNY